MDICMCRGEGCLNKEQCYRFLAEPNYLQSYFIGSPLDDNGNCLYFWIVNKEGKRCQDAAPQHKP